MGKFGLKPKLLPKLWKRWALLRKMGFIKIVSKLILTEIVLIIAKIIFIRKIIVNV